MKEIKSHENIRTGLIELQKLDPSLIPIIKQTPSVALRRDQQGFQGLARIIIGQHVSTASAAAIHARFITEISPITPQNYLIASQDTLTKIGLTKAKQSTLTILSTAIMEKTLDLDTINQLPEQEAIAQLTSLKGIGPWTAEVYLLFCAGHPDIFAAGDLAIREAVRQAFNMAMRPPEKELRSIALKWSPLRGIASRLFWSYYAVIKGQDKGQPL